MIFYGQGDHKGEGGVNTYGQPDRKFLFLTTSHIKAPAPKALPQPMNVENGGAANRKVCKNCTISIDLQKFSYITKKTLLPNLVNKILYTYALCKKIIAYII